ncbi:MULTISPECIES: hypothetical protein [unclassified Micromonospora]|uniref:hypothetical protein n=1 Tax=unclassified Micromonospora TaxID=2617518 RepID=UPI001C22A5BE|nr:MULTISPECIES: hypothetical protein [unclassified Micromonospora]MBU8859389.1 hypothetical protein [Micromonospora sp. WMMB482]MDM4778902.1 hypothetical protein [Micromonospora sp. b486]
MLTPGTGPAPALAPLAARWVAWVAAHRQPVNPLKDTTGRHGGRHQPDDVWFLAGTQGGGVSRRCVVRAGHDGGRFWVEADYELEVR